MPSRHRLGTVAETRGVVQHAVCPESVSLRCTELISIDVVGPRLDLRPILSSAAGSLRLGLLFHIRKRHLPCVEDSCQRHVGTRCIRCRCFLMLWLGSQRRSPLQNPSTSVLRGRLVSFCSNLPSHYVLPLLLGASSGVTSSLAPSLSTFSAKISEHKLGFDRVSHVLRNPRNLSSCLQ